MSSYSYDGLGHFPFHILRDQLPDGRPFIHIDNWNGTTLLNGRPSGSSVDWLPVYGPGSEYCLPMTEWEFSIYYWRQRTIKIEWDVSIDVPAATATVTRTSPPNSNSASASLGAMDPDLQYSTGENFADGRVERRYFFGNPSSFGSVSALKEGHLPSPQKLQSAFQNPLSEAQAYENQEETDTDTGGAAPLLSVLAEVHQRITMDVVLPSVDPQGILGSWNQSRQFGMQTEVIIAGGFYWLRFPLWDGSAATGEITAVNQATANGAGSKSKLATRKLFLNAWGLVASVPASATEVTEGLVDVEWNLPGYIVTGKNHFLSYLLTTSTDIPGTGTQTISAPDPTVVINKITVTPTAYLTYGGAYSATTGL